jgi:allantoinase
MKLFVNASLPTSSSAFKRVNLLFDEQIIKISADEIVTEEEPEIIDLKGRILLPGAIDIHSHLIAAHKNLKQTLSQATKSALKGGWTTLAEMSFHTDAPIFDTTDLKKTIAALQGNIHTDMALWAHVDVTEYPYYAESAQELWAKGVVGITLMTPSPNDDVAEMSFSEIMDLFMDIYESDTEFAFQGYDVDTHDAFTFEAQMDGIKKILRRMQENPIHIPRVSSYQTIEFINSISKRSDISFAINMMDMMHFLDPEAFSPPWITDFREYYELLYELLRTKKLYLLSNSCSMIKAESELFDGNSPDLMEYSYLWVLSELWKNRKIPLSTCIKMTSENPAKRLGIYPQKGRIDSGSDADFVIYNPEATTTITSPKGKQLELVGAIESVWLRGTLQHDGSKAMGMFVSRSNSPKRRHNNSSWV